MRYGNANEWRLKIEGTPKGLVELISIRDAKEYKVKSYLRQEDGMLNLDKDITVGECKKAKEIFSQWVEDIK